MSAERRALPPGSLARGLVLWTVAALAGIAHAQTFLAMEQNRTVVTFPDEQGLPGVLGTHSAAPMRTGAVALGATNGLLMGGSMAKTSNGGAPTSAKSLDDALIASMRGFIAVGVGLGVDASLALPWYYESLPGTGSSPEAWSLGDLTGALKVRLPFDLPYISFCLFAQGTAPTSSADGSILPKELTYHPADGRYPDPLTHASGFSRPSAGAGAGVSLDLSQAA
jgi:hypothetical protein